MEENKSETPILLPEEGGLKNEGKCCDDKKIKNMISIIILLAGLFVGSIFVDVAQMVRGKGFSQKVLNKTDVFSLDGKTWVAYTEPVVKVQVITDENCEACKTDQPLVWFRRVIPTILPEKIDSNSMDGKNMLKDFGIKSIPAFIFSQDVEKTDFFSQAGALFTAKNGKDVLQTSQLGIEPGKFVENPAISDQDIQIGVKDAKVKVVEFSDFQCPYCRAFQLSTVQKMLKDYGDKILFVYKNLPLDIHPQAEPAALAAECANEQGKFEDYSTKLFSSQDDWAKSTGTQKFKTYAAQMGLNTTQFNKCLDDKKYQDKVSQDKNEASDFGISGTPAIFINDQFKGGAVSFDDIKKVLDEQLMK
jgi:predicted DsbA family dithiol-disulfide isomerase